MFLNSFPDDKDMGEWGDIEMRCQQCGCDNPSKMFYCAQCGTPLRKSGNGLFSEDVEGRSSEPGKTPSCGFRKKVKLIPFAALIWMLIAGLVTGKEMIFPENGYASAYDAIDTLEDPIDNILECDFDDAALNEYSAVVRDALPGGAGPKDVEINIDALKSYPEGFRDLLRFADEDSAGAGLGIVTALTEAGELENASLSVISDEMKSAGVVGNVETGYAISLSVTIAAYEDTSILKQGDEESAEIDDIGVYAVQVDGRWYLWPHSCSQPKEK